MASKPKQPKPNAAWKYTFGTGKKLLEKGMVVVVGDKSYSKDKAVPDVRKLAGQRKGSQFRSHLEKDNQLILVYNPNLDNHVINISGRRADVAKALDLAYGQAGKGEQIITNGAYVLNANNVDSVQSKEVIAEYDNRAQSTKKTKSPKEAAPFTLEQLEATRAAIKENAALLQINGGKEAKGKKVGGGGGKGKKQTAKQRLENVTTVVASGGNALNLNTYATKGLKGLTRTKVTDKTQLIKFGAMAPGKYALVAGSSNRDDVIKFLNEVKSEGFDAQKADQWLTEYNTLTGAGGSTSGLPVSSVGGSGKTLPSLAGGVVSDLPPLGGGNVSPLPTLGGGSTLPTLGGGAASSGLPPLGGNVSPLTSLGGSTSPSLMGGSGSGTLPPMRPSGIPSGMGSPATLGGGTGFPAMTTPVGGAPTLATGAGGAGGVGLGGSGVTGLPSMGKAEQVVYGGSSSGASLGEMPTF